MDLVGIWCVGVDVEEKNDMSECFDELFSFFFSFFFRAGGPLIE